MMITIPLYDDVLQCIVEISYIYIFVCEEENAEEEKQVEEEVEPTQVKKLLCKLRWINNIILSFRT